MRQVASCLRTPDQTLIELYKERRIQHLNDPREVLYDILKRLIGIFDGCHIIIDGLDEYHKPRERNSLLQALGSIEAPNMSIMLLSRPHLDDVCINFRSHRKMAVWANEKDLQTYCYAVIRADENLAAVEQDFKNWLVEEVVKKAQGM